MKVGFAVSGDCRSTDREPFPVVRGSHVESQPGGDFMCRRVECSQCKKPTFAGCGMHVEQVLGDVPRQDRCTCREKAEKPAKKADGEPGSVLRRLFGR